ncbi:MAG: Smr/MutS family protein, partial [Acidobacteriota bacterium]
LERLRGDGVHVVATTHHQSIKAWAYRTEGVLNAAVDFEDETLSPTYRLVPGGAGASLGLTMALQLGLEESVVVDARRRLDPAGEEASQALDAIRALASDLERQRAELVARRRQIETKAELQRVKLEGERERLRSDWSSRVERLVSEFRKEADRMISRLASTQDKRRLARQRAGMERELKQQFAVAAPPVGPPPEGWMPEPGDRVGVASLGREGVVHSVRGARAEIDLGRSRFSVAVEDLRPIEAAAETNNETRARTAGGRSEPGRHQLPPVESAAAQFADRTVAPELHLLGQRVEEAMATLDKDLDDAYLAGLAEVRVVHGIGTGRLRRAVRERLDDHLEVVSWREARPEEGGAGATIVRLAEETP